ncbi:MAG: sugar ABC transporter permease [Ruminococcaceae bacterium]|nr:sugar ABC transporter permease [Oscillospiraceae bacterium]
MTVGYRARQRTANGVIYLLLGTLGVLWVLPIVYLVILSLRGESGAYLPYLLPKNWSLENYRRLFTDTALFNYPRWYMNTLLVSICTCVLSTLLVLSVSYTFSRLRFPSRRKFMNVGLILGMFPGFMTMIAVYHLLKVLGLAQSLIALILVYSAGSCMGYFIAKGYFDTIPRSLDEAATLDGATRHQIFFRITLPMSTPILAYTALTAFMVPWTDFIFVSVIMKDNYQNYTLALGLYQMVTKENIYRYFTAFCAGSVLVAIPITLLFLRLQKYYVEGVTGGAVKG